MREERRKELCELLELIEEHLVIELLHSWRDRKVSEFWTGVDQLRSFMDMKEKVCNTRVVGKRGETG